jgi:hypothetical protein
MVKTYFWLSQEKRKFINSHPEIVSLLYDLGLLPEEISARVRAYVEEERERCAKIAEEAAIPGHNVQGPSCISIAKKIREG